MNKYRAIFGEGDLYEMLQDMRFRFSTDKEMAQSLGISPRYLHNVFEKRQPITKKLADALGFEPIRQFVKKEANT